ncbi:MAG TPA: ABC transporter ATP-binding protein [Gemmatimonadota bacterium]|nr:ABC transporter ATP-binding protein [Gemmatimonadota bacterium]
MSLWLARGLAYRYPGSPVEAVREVDLDVGDGEVVALVGPNGAGKTTLLLLLLGQLPPLRGRVEFAGRPLDAWSPGALARRVGVLPQHEEPAFPVTVRELVAMGRYPHLGAWRQERPSDVEAVAAAVGRCGLAELTGRPFATLSGGERQRARLARALAQGPEALVLDEPTAGLDVASEMEMWELLRREARAGRGVLLTTHNLNLAARFADRLLLLSGGRLLGEGAATDVVTEPRIGAAYGWPVRVFPHSGPGPDRGAPQVVPLRPNDEPERKVP